MPRGQKRNARGGLIQSAGPSSSTDVPNTWDPHSISMTTITVPVVKKARGSRKARLEEVSSRAVQDDVPEREGVTGEDGAEGRNVGTETVIDQAMDVDAGLQPSSEYSGVPEPSGDNVDVYIGEQTQSVRRYPY